MTTEKKLVAPKRRTRAEVQQLVAEFVSSGMRRSEFCRSRGLSFGTLNRHLKKQRWKRKSRAASSAGRFGRLVPVELAARKSPTQQEPSCGLAPVATPIVVRMDELFAVDAEARHRVIGLTGRHALRQERAKPLLDDIRSKIEAAQSVALPSSALTRRSNVFVSKSGCTSIRLPPGSTTASPQLGSC
jgi:hypothetical protein